MILNLAAARQQLERQTCRAGGSEYALALRRATLRPSADRAFAPQAVEVEVTGVRLRNGCAISPGIPLCLIAWVSDHDHLVEVIHQAWGEMIDGLELQSLAAALPASAAVTPDRQGGLLSSVLQRFA